ncbi:Rv1733c family protein [Streptomyces pristinaespiralis]|uniref:Rv1733c family protein n=1 Tax=Streptomyces pristinaespiralis TaxID=38300 RepID=UPI0033F203A8
MTAPLPRAQPPPARARVRLWRWRRGPLRRRSDALQAWTGLVLALAVAAAAPAATVIVHNSVHGSLRAGAAADARSRAPVDAVLVRDVPRHPEPGSEEARHTLYPAEVRFFGPDGRPRTGQADVRPGLSAGSTVRVWRDAQGRLTDPPMAAGEIRSRALGWAAAAGAAVALTGAGAYGVTAMALDRRRDAGWERAWADTGPRWTTSV